VLQNNCQHNFFEKSLSSKKLKFSKTAIYQTVTRFKTFGSFQALHKAGRWKITSQTDDRMTKKMCSLTTSSKKLWWDLLLTGHRYQYIHHKTLFQRWIWAQSLLTS